GVIEQKSEIQIRTRRHLGAARPSQCNNRERLRVTEGSLLRLRPLTHQRRVNRCPRRNDTPSVSEFRTADQRVIFLNKPLESRQGTGLACNIPDSCYFS